VYYCQDCGGANAASATSCRICGHQLVRDRGSAPCQSCGAPTVEGANFCSLCGTATVTAPTVSLAEMLPGSLKVDAVVADERQATAARMGAAINLGEGLELPDWLKRAAAEQPYDPNRQNAVAADPFGPAGAGAATLTAARPGGIRNGSATDLDLGSRPPLSIPVSRPAASVQGPTPPVDEQSATVPAAAARPADVSDTSTFISEDDLPEWIRQLAAADEAKKADEMRRASEAAAVERQPAPATDPRRRRPLPGEAAPSGPATSPWLTRRERADGQDTVAADTWGAGTIQPAAIEDQATMHEAVPVAVVEPHVVPDLPVAQQEPARATAKAAGRPNQLRVVLIAATVLFVVALLAFMALS
jgi:hypothetical protein